MRLDRLRKLLKCHFTRCHQLQQRIAEHIFVFPIVKPMLQLIMPGAARLAAHIGFVHFHNAPQKLAVGVTHRRTDAMAEEPCGLVGNSNCALNLAGRDTLLGFRHHVDRKEPLGQRHMAVMKDRAGRGGELIQAALALVLIALFTLGNLGRMATRASDATGPAQMRQPGATLVVRAKPLNDVHQVQL